MNEDIPDRTTLRELLDHHDWAMDRILEAAGELPAGALDRQSDPVPTTLRRVLHHLAEAEDLWLCRWREVSASGLTEPDPGRPLADLADGWRRTAAARTAFLEEEGETGERRAIPYRSLRGDAFHHPLGDLMLHLANHGAHHRAQAASLLRRAGEAPPPLDYLSMRRERPTSQEGAQAGTTPESPAAFDPETILEYYRYADWAGRRFQEGAAALDDEALDREVPIGLGALRRTLLHVHDAEAWWIGAWQGRDPASFRDLPEDTSVPDFIRQYEETARSTNAFQRAAGPAGLQRVVAVKTAGGARLYWRVGESALQCCLHGTHHRAQLVWTLRALGVDPPDLDYVTWLRAGSP